MDTSPSSQAERLSIIHSSYSSSLTPSSPDLHVKSNHSAQNSEKQSLKRNLSHATDDTTNAALTTSDDDHYSVEIQKIENRTSLRSILNESITINMNWDEPGQTVDRVSDIVTKVKNKRFLDQQVILKSVLAESRDGVLSGLKKPTNSFKHGGDRRLKRNDDDYKGGVNCSLNRKKIFPRLPSHVTNLNINSNENSKKDHNEYAETTSNIQSINEKGSKNRTEKCISIKYHQNKSFKVHQSLNPIHIEGTHSPTPLSTATIFLQQHYAVDDQKELTFLPYFGDKDTDENIEDVKDLFDLKRREDMVEYGPEYKQEDVEFTVKDILESVIEEMKNDLSKNDPLSKRHAIMTKNICPQIANILGIQVDKVLQIYNLYFPSLITDDIPLSADDSVSDKDVENSFDKNHDNEDESNEDASTISSNIRPKNSDIPSTPSTPSSNGNGRSNMSYIDAMDSYRSLFCRQCFIYDCNIHGNLPQPNLKTQTELAIQKEISEEKEQNDGSKNNDNHGDKKRKLQAISSSILDNSYGQTCIPCTKLKENSENKLSPLYKVICEHAFQIFRGDVEKLATIYRTGIEEVTNFINEANISLHSYVQFHLRNSNNHDEPKKKKTKTSERKAMKSYNHTWLKRVKDKEIHPAFYPCNHDGPCSEETCSCVQNANFCTKHCIWGKQSRNMFRGCNCKNAQCQTNACPCFAANRECDPDLCHNCQAGTDPPGRPATKQRCRNDNISMRRHCHLLLAKSGVENAGWGIYNKHFLKKGSFVHEYIGELISQEEAERRGVLYDKMNRSYLFNLTSDTVIDASRKGNKMKFANHSSTPNCYAKVLTVNGDSRVGLFAKEDIEPQTELLFDYAYDISMSNDLIEKSAIKFDWMKTKVSNKKHA